jgi:peptidoglycan/xylan/chitin deacetylase (PgdA/CDA1 family)
MRLVCLLALAALGPPAQGAERFDIAITVDDLPVHGALPNGMTRRGIAHAYLQTLKAHRVPEAYGFVNGKHMADDPAAQAILAAWRAAGHPLGNHTYSHMNLDRAASIEPWKADVDAGAAAAEKYMKRQGARYFRFPNLARGSDPTRRQQAAAHLQARGYRIAEVSLAFSDWSYSDAYARCLAKGDSAAIAAMKAQYLDGVDQAITRMKTVSRRVYGRVIPQVLLTHLGGFAAMMLPDVMARLEAAGARYVTLARAQAHPAFAEAQALPGGGGIMERTAKARGIDLSDIREPLSARNVSALCR